MYLVPSSLLAPLFPCSSAPRWVLFFSMDNTNKKVMCGILLIIRDLITIPRLYAVSVCPHHIVCRLCFFFLSSCVHPSWNTFLAFPYPAIENTSTFVL